MGDSETIANYYLQNKPDEWLIAAIMEGSLGHHTHKNAKMLVRDYRRGVRQDASTRCLSLFGGNLTDELLHDFQGFNGLNENRQGQLKRLAGVSDYV